MTLKLLLAGKEPADFQPIKTAFENADATIITATSMALALYLARKNLPDIVICQQFLTDSEGISLFYELKNEQELEKIPFIILVPNQQTNQNIADSAKSNSLKIDTGAKDIHLLSIATDIENTDNVSSLKEEILAILDLYH